MATTLASLQSYAASPLTRVPSSGSRSHNNSVASPFPPRQRRTDSLRVRCQAEDRIRKEEEPTPVSPTSTSPASPPRQTSTPPPPAPPKVSTRFSDVLAFSGPAPERINGRLAMVGFVAALAVELARGDGLASQLAGGGLTWFAGTAAVLSAASLVPLFKGVSVQSRSDGLMTSDAEMWNGRFAMLGLVALAFTEYLKGGPLV